MTSPGVRGWYDAHRGTIVVRSGLTFAERRSTLAHELIHADRGDSRAENLWEDMRQEEHVRTIAARECISIRQLAFAIATSTSELDAAGKLNVDLPTLRRRIAGLTPVEADYIDRVVKQTPKGARHG